MFKNFSENTQVVGKILISNEKYLNHRDNYLTPFNPRLKDSTQYFIFG